MYVRQLSERALQNCFCIRMCGQITQTRFPPQMDARADDGDDDDDNEWKVMLVIVIRNDSADDVDDGGGADVK
jgi:hypothetical protein